MRYVILAVSLVTLATVLVLRFTSDLPSVHRQALEPVAMVDEPWPVAIPLPGYPGCVASVDQLPSSRARLDPADPRLKEDRIIVVLKSARRLMLFSDGKIRSDRAGDKPDCWKAGLGVRDDGQDAGVFDKMIEGDRRTPEGWFATSDRPWSSFYHAIMIHYPDEQHAKAGLARGSITKVQMDQIARAQKSGSVPPQGTPLGGNILIHGGTSEYDWTWGCVALNDADIDELRSALPEGMRTWILILP